MMKMDKLGWMVLILLGVLGCNQQSSGTRIAESTPKSSGGPRLVVPKTQLDIGEVDLAQPTSPTFTVTNGGDLPLRLTLAKKSCKCTNVEINPAEIAPGQSGQVILRWAPIPGQTG